MTTFRVSAEETIAAPVERVWELVSDTSRYAEWVEGTLQVTRTDGPARLGSTYDEINSVAGPIRSASHWRVVEFDAPRRQVHRDESIPFLRSFDIIIETSALEPARTRLAVTLRGESKLGPLGALLARLLGRYAKASNRRNVARFRELVERETRPAGSD